ncbi:pitrilysin family protein [Psychrobium sp. 1_MG-2023]|uniref:M16 family metallopeptidase n=1 Tax=Psychrobium sp. 1_MG-2023 TaxID=3062624 RepID=UPI000C340151|nr:pitrilysin family protein [Psychrobium sp. 1_MG-2023]MDP2560837.1 pitrilysin family protein [Psychrobium sp. 1_MG-2023]PKF56711.1 peptidase M16 [Alteromonadales bacterium alter-6D02]
MKNYKKAFALSALALAIAGCNLTNSLPEPAPAAQGAVTLDIEKFTLDNGLEVVLHQDKSDPVVAVAIQYHVGSNREKLGRTGFAHFFEHMLFQNSEHVGAGQFIKNIGAMGGSLNGGTWQDGTIYYEVVPNDGLEKVLWMESDRMGYFINTVTQAGLENEKQVVKNEKRQSVDNRPYGHAYGVTLEALYPEGHPYSWSVIGSLEDLQNATLQDVRDFYQQWYGVNNATLVLAGDFDKAQAKAWIEKYFSEFKPRGNVTPLPPMPVTLTENKSLYHEDNFAKLPQLTMTLPTVDHNHPDKYALEMLAKVLSDGKDSVLYQSVVEEDKIAPGANAYVSHGELAGTFSFSVRTFDGVDLDRAKVSLDKAFAKFVKAGASEAQIARILTAKETDFYNGLTSVFSKASSLATANEFHGDPSYITKQIAKYQQVTAADISRVFKEYILNKNYVATSFVPKGQLDLALEGAVKANVVEEKIVQGAEKTLAQQTSSAPLTPVAQPKPSFDRSIVPSYGETPVVTLPKVWQSELDNGVNVLGIAHNELPLVSFSIRIKGGHSLDSTGKHGTANLLTDIMMEGTRNKTPQQLEDRLGELGAELNFYVHDEYISLQGNVLSKNYGEAIALAQEIILEPRWDESEWARVKQKTLASIQQADANPGAIAANVYGKLLYGNSNFGTPEVGTAAEVEAITLEDVKAFYQHNVSAQVTSVHVAGKVTQQQVAASLTPLATQLSTQAVNIVSAKERPTLSQAQLYFVDVPGAKQSFIRIGSRAMTADSVDYYPAVAVNHNLGGSFSGQLFQILRLEKGYTYGAYSGFSRSNVGGAFTASSSVRSNVTLESLQTFREILTKYGQEFDQEALASTQSILAKQDARAFETTGSLMGVLENVTTFGLANDYVAAQQQTLRDLTLEQAQQIINTYMNPDEMIYLVVGDAKTQLPRMKELGLGEPIVLDKRGNPVK